MADLSSIINQLTKLKPIGSTPDDLQSGTVALFADPWWSSSRHNIVLDDHTMEDRHVIPNNAIDNTTWVAWNLPIGIVVTLTDHYRSRDPKKYVGDLDGLGPSVDLVGTGRAQSTDLRDCGMNDIVANFFWRDVDLRYGAVEMFADLDFTGIRQTLFLSEWPPGVTHTLPGSYMNDNMTSIRWRSLNENQKVVFQEHPDGGKSFTDVKGWGSIKENPNLCNYGYNDCISAFYWNPVLPVKEVIEPITIKALGRNANSQTAEESYVNNTDVEQTFSVSWTQTKTKGLSVATTETHVAGVKASMSTKAEVDAGVAKAEVSYSLELSYEYTNSTTKTEETTDSVAITYTRDIKASPHGKTTATMILQIGQVPETMYKTKATRWYRERVADSTRDPENNLWRREESTMVTVAGGLATSLNTTTRFEKY